MADDGDSEYECEACGREFETEAALRDHIRTVGLVY
ncbi:MAG: C2H2-type zinc finger protein [Halobacteriaceae archaeon]